MRRQDENKYVAEKIVRKFDSSRSNSVKQIGREEVDGKKNDK